MNEYIKMIDSTLNMFEKLQKGLNINYEYSEYLKNHPNDKLIKELFSSIAQ